MKYVPALLLICSLALPGCLSAPAKQSDQDRAGEQITKQAQDNSPMRMDREASKTVKVEITMTGENATLTFQPNTAAITGDVETGGNQGVQGSTDAAQGSTTTQTPTATQDIPVDVSIPATK